MSSAVTAVMYHYVRPIGASRYPQIKGLELAEFESQLDHIQQAYDPVSFSQVIGAWRGECDLPRRPLLLTFDDGYADHFEFVLPRLAERGIEGVFFVPSAPVLDHVVLDVNKVHFVLAMSSDPAALAAKVTALVERHAAEPGMLPLAEYRRCYFVADSFDSAEVIFVKRMLQHVLPQPLRSQIVDELFRAYVTTDEAAFATELYVSVAQLKAMADAGMCIGTHTHSHPWLSKLSPTEQRAEITKSLILLDKIKVPRAGFTFSFPYSDYNADTLAILDDMGCAAAMTARPDFARKEQYGRLELPRFDTNELPPRSMRVSGSAFA